MTFTQHSTCPLDGDDMDFKSFDRSPPEAGQGALRSLIRCFGLSGYDVEKSCRAGGERARLVVAKMLFNPRRDQTTVLDALAGLISKYCGS